MEKIENKLEIAKDICLFTFAVLFMSIPIFRNMTFSVKNVLENEVYFIWGIGWISLAILVVYVIFKIKRSENKKELLKELLPIGILMLYMCWTLISCIFSPNTELAFWGNKYRNDGYFTYLAYAGFFAMTFTMKSYEFKKALLNVFIVTALVGIVTVELPRNGYLKQFFWNTNLTRNSFFQFNHYGYYLMLSSMVANIMFIMEKKKVQKVMYLFAYAIVLYYLVLNNTFGCYLAFFVTLLIFLIVAIVKKQKIVLVAVSLCVFLIMSAVHFKKIVQPNLLTLYNDIKKVESAIQENFETEEVGLIKLEDKKKMFTQFSVVSRETVKVASSNVSGETKNDVNVKKTKTNIDSVGTSRMKLWRYGLQFFLERPILGFGPDNLGEKYESVHAETGQDRPHNIIIQLLTTSGIAGCLLYAVAIGMCVKRGFSKLDFSNMFLTVSLFTVLAYLISSMFGNSMFYTSPFFFIMLGILLHEIVSW